MKKVRPQNEFLFHLDLIFKELKYFFDLRISKKMMLRVKMFFFSFKKMPRKCQN